MKACLILMMRTGHVKKDNIKKEKALGVRAPKRLF